jgi:hypothetical protein
VSTAGGGLAKLNGWFLLRCIANEQHSFLVKALFLVDRLRTFGNSSEEGFP